MTEKKYFPAIYLNSKADHYEAVCGVRMVCLLKASLLARDYQSAQQESWHNPLHPSSLHSSRVGFLKAVSEWPENTVLQLHISANPNLLFTPKGKISLAISLHSFDKNRNLASEAVLSRFLHMKGLLSIYFPEAEFTPITDVVELRQEVSPFSPTHALSITRRRETLSLGKPFNRGGIGFGSALHQDENPDHTTVHLFPWTPSFSKWHKLMQFFLRQTDPLWVIVRVRPGKLTDADQKRLSKTIETCEEFLNKTRECKNVLTKMAEMMRDFSLERMVELHSVALNVSVFMLASHAIDPSESSVLGQAITEGYNRDEKKGLFYEWELLRKVTDFEDVAHSSSNSLNVIEQFAIDWEQILKAIDHYVDRSTIPPHLANELNQKRRQAAALTVGLKEDEFLIKGHGHSPYVDQEIKIADAGCWLGKAGSYLVIEDGQVSVHEWKSLND